MDVMRLDKPAIPALALALCAALAAGCGGSTKTVTVASAPPATQTSTTPADSTQTSAETTTTTTAATPPASGEASTTRTASEPAFAEQEAKPEESGTAGAAAAVVRAHGFVPNDLSEYHSDQTLRVLVGSEGSVQRAFFFLDGRYLGTDTKEPSAKLKVVSQSDSEVSIAYSLYGPGEQPCCSHGTQTVVHFQLNDGKLAAAQAIPPAHSSTGLSRN
jgi:LppP/LprE lipoprotein